MVSLLKKEDSDSPSEKPKVLEGNLIIPFKIYGDGRRFYGKGFEVIKGAPKGTRKDRVGKKIGGKIATEKTGEFEL